MSVNIPDPADDTDTLYAGTVAWRDLFDRAKRRYWPRPEAEKARRAVEERKEWEEKARRRRAKVDAVLESYRQWPLEREAPELGLKVYAYALPGGGRLCAIAADDKPLYRWPLYREYDASGQIVPHDGGTGWFAIPGNDILSKIDKTIGEEAKQ